jgi:signal recognition particle subunit SEC65
MIFELIVMRAAKEFVVQIFPPATLNSQEEILQSIKDIYAIDMPINDISLNFIPQIAKAFVKLKNAGHFKDTYYPNSVYKGATYSLKKAVQYIEKHYHIPDITRGMEFIVNLDQYIGREITPRLIKICNENSKANLQDIVAENPDMDEIYAYIGAHHLNIFHDDLAIKSNSGHKKHNPIHLEVTIGHKLIKLHLFPDSHLNSHAYRSFKAYAGKHAIKTPKLNKLKAIVTKLGCEATHKALSKYYFSDEELGFLICATVKNYSNYTEK